MLETDKQHYNGCDDGNDLLIDNEKKIMMITREVVIIMVEVAYIRPVAKQAPRSI